VESTTVVKIVDLGVCEGILSEGICAEYEGEGERAESD
jgi:hypothetical protein